MARLGQPAPTPAEALKQTAPVPEEGPTHIQVDDFGNESVRDDKLDRLAQEMLSLHERKRRGEAKQRQLRSLGAERGFAPSGTQVSASARRNRFFADPGTFRRSQEALEREASPVDYDGFVDQPSYYALAGDDIHFNPRAVGSLQMPLPKRKRRRLFGWRRVLPFLAIALLVGVGLFSLYQFVLKPWLVQRQEAAITPQPVITASILDEMAAHTISIPAPEGAQIYIKELRKSYIVTGGYATFQVADYIWYELMEEVTEPSMEVELTPYIRTSSGEQRQMDSVRYTIDIPLSPITMLNPDVTRLEVSTPVYNIRFHVMQNSRVLINGEDYSSFVNTQSGFITYNADVQPVGDNIINISVRSQYYRENTVSINIYRAVQDIPLDLASTLDDESSNDSMTIHATTRAGATITVLSPHKNLDVSQLGSTGVFSFEAVFPKIGYNTVEIRADFPDKNPTTVKYDVYYLPSPDIYTRKAWALDSWGYPDLLANLTTRINNTQIYTFTGPVKEIVSNKPQLVLFDAADGSGSERLVMVENQTKTQWELGQRYRLYADAFGIYGNIPRLIARYTYKPKAP
ncbi:MAG: hypothetical protein GXY84_02735 [Clostridiales bacterium]|nr:hypothetical protein [Clostridiales bacterium]